MQASGRRLDPSGAMMGKHLTRLVTALATAHLLFACAMLDEILPQGEDPGVRDEQASKALVALNKLQDVDAYIKLDNGLLGAEIESELNAQAQAMDGVEFTRLKVRFKRQHIVLESTLLATLESGQVIEGALSGDVLLAFSGGHLIWMPRFDELVTRENGFDAPGGSQEGQGDDFAQGLIDRVNGEVADAVIVLGKNVIGIDPVPMGRIEVGARLSDFMEASARDSHSLGGVFTVAGSAILIEPRVTSIALDLEFIPSVSTCPADVYVSRSAFAREIRAREPVGVTRLVDEVGDVRHFFSEISGASRSTTVIHYWFADGQPVAVEELPVEPSFRWRTWSSKTIDRSAGSWEVIVVEKSTGCILHSLALRADPAVEPAGANGRPMAQTTFEQFLFEFRSRVAGFSILDDKPEVALVEVPRGFLSTALHASLKDTRINVDFDISGQAGRRVSAGLRPFDASGISCEERVCAPQRECIAGFTQCVKQRDTRDCGTCLFRNPLNGRCVNEGVDPICEAAKARQNNIYEAQMQSCLHRETAGLADCERLRDQEIRSCEIEAASEKSACEAGRQIAENLAGAEAFASATGQVRTTGGLRAVFSDFEVEGELTGLRLNLGFSAALDLDGTVRFSPRPGLGPLAPCISRWRGTYRSKIIMPLAANSMFGAMRVQGPRLATDWSGYVLPAEATPAPLEAVFVEQPELLADCRIGLTVDQVTAAMTGDNGEYFAGKINFEIQPLPSVIDLAPATVDLGGMRYSSPPSFNSTHLRFDIGQP